MKHLDEHRDPARVATLTRALGKVTRRPWAIMEVCGGQTHSIARHGLDQLLPEGLTLLHGPGCPVCVTPVAVLDHAQQIAATPGVIFCSFGDMLRVPSSAGDLRQARARGADVRVLSGPLDALALAEKNPGSEVVFFAVGFETTAPAVAMTAREARRRGLNNLSLLVSHVRVPPAIDALLSAPEHGIQGFLAAGHVAAVMGFDEYRPLCKRYHTPIVITGFEPEDLLLGILMCVQLLEAGNAGVVNAYARVVRPEGNPGARALLAEVFEHADQTWRGLGEIPQSGLRLRPPFDTLDAALRFPRRGPPGVEDPRCQAGLVLQGRLQPSACAAFGVACTPESPLGAPMVSAEGACAAWYHHRRRP